MRVSSEWPIDITVFILTEVLNLSYDEMTVLCPRFLNGSHNRVEMEYHRESRRLLEEREERYLQELSSYRIYFWEILPEHWTLKIKCLAVKLHHPNIWRIPEEDRTYDVWMSYATKTGYLSDIPMEYRTYQICMICLVRYPLYNYPHPLLSYIPTPFMTRKLLDVAEGWR